MKSIDSHTMTREGDIRKLILLLVFRDWPSASASISAGFLDGSEKVYNAGIGSTTSLLNVRCSRLNTSHNDGGRGGLSIFPAHSCVVNACARFIVSTSLLFIHNCIFV